MAVNTKVKKNLSPLELNLLNLLDLFTIEQEYGISLVGENIYEKIKKEAVMIEEKRTKESKDKGEKSEEHDPIKHAKEKLELSSNIDFIIPSTDATNPFFYVRALSPEEAKKMIKDLQSNLENGYGIKIDLEKLEVEDKKYKS